MDMKAKIVEKAELPSGAGSIVIETEKGNRMEIALSREEMQSLEATAGDEIHFSVKAIKEEKDESKMAKLQLDRPSAEVEAMLSVDEKPSKAAKKAQEEASKMSELNDKGSTSPATT